MRHMTFEIVPRRFLSPFSDFWDDARELMHTPWTQSGLSISRDNKKGTLSVKAAVPGLDPEDIHVKHEDGKLVIQGKSKTEDKDETSSWSYYYEMTVPQDADATAEPEATVKNGVLTLNYKTAARPQPKEIPVKSLEK